MVDKSAHYLMNKDGVYYFTRHVPNDLQRHYDKPRIVMCLKTRNKMFALKASQSLASKLDDFWLQMRISNMDAPAANLLIKDQPKETFTSCAPKLSDALEKYCRLKGKDRGEQFFKAAYRNDSHKRIAPFSSLQFASSIFIRLTTNNSCHQPRQILTAFIRNI